MYSWRLHTPGPSVALGGLLSNMPVRPDGLTDGRPDDGPTFRRRRPTAFGSDLFAHVCTRKQKKNGCVGV